MKALGVGMFAFNYRDVEVVKARSGAPSLRLTGKAALLAEQRGVTTWHLSITHTERTAQAIAIAE
jgi:holo-[acyl-carrier protein] synthase